MSEDFRAKARQMLTMDEGYRAKPYRDSVGKLTIGVGRNLDDIGLSKATIEQMLDEDIDRAVAGAVRILGEELFCSLSINRKLAVINMVFNLGEAGFSKFKNTLEAIKSGNWQRAAAHALASKWASQVGRRASRVTALFLDNYPPEYL